MRARYIGKSNGIFSVGEIYNLRAIPTRTSDSYFGALKNIIRVVDEYNYDKKMVYESMTKFMEDWEKINPNNVFTLRDFVMRFVNKNSLVRIWAPNKDGHGHHIISSDDKNVAMAHNIVNRMGWISEYSDCEFIEVADINCEELEYPEAINIVIRDKYSPKEKIDNLTVTFSQI